MSEAETMILLERQAKRIKELEKAIRNFCLICRVNYGENCTPCCLCALRMVAADE
jgi:hypothetical protein